MLDNRSLTVRFVLSIGLVLLLLAWRVAYADHLTLEQAENVALSQSPEIKALQEKARALDQSAIAARQLPDPKLMMGAMNVPVDTFQLSQEPMTQVQVGLMQSFPRGRSLYYRSLQEKDLSVAELHKMQVMGLQVLKGVRLSWLGLYYWLHAKQFIVKQKKVFRHLVEVTESMLANNKAKQNDIVRAHLELAELDIQLLDIEQKIEAAEATLARWVGPKLAQAANPKRLPTWPKMPGVVQFHNMIKQHPILKTDEAFISAGHASVQLAEQQYKPGFSVTVAYGFRQGRDRTSSRNRPDFLTAQMSMDLPLFTHSRQDRTLAASHGDLREKEENQMSHYRQLCEALKTQYAAWQKQKNSASLYRSSVVPKAKQYAEATLTAYQNAQIDFSTLARAYVRELDTELDELKANVNRERARAHLLYLQGK